MLVEQISDMLKHADFQLAQAQEKLRSGNWQHCIFYLVGASACIHHVVELMRAELNQR